MDEGAVRAIQEHVVSPAVYQTDRGERLIAPVSWKDITEPQSQTHPVTVTTLTGLRDFVLHGVDGYKSEACMLHVVNPTQVVVIEAAAPERWRYRRNVLAMANHTPVIPGRHEEDETSRYFSNFIQGPQDMMVVALMTSFEETPDRAALLALISSVVASATRQSLDDTVTQETTVRRGATMRSDVKVRNPWMLAPFRTFAEVDQPQSPFVLRLDGGDEETVPRFRLLLADGGAWKNEAMASIGKWLRAQMPGYTVVA